MIRDEDIGGGVVRRTFRMGESQLRSGHALTRDQILSMAPSNRRALIEKGNVEVFGRLPEGKRMIIQNGTGYDVIEGRVINPKPLSIEQAREMVGIIEAPAPIGTTKTRKAKTKH